MYVIFQEIKLLVSIFLRRGYSVVCVCGRSKGIILTEFSCVVSLLSVNNMLILFMYGINLQLFNSKLRISIFDNLPKSYILRKTCSFVQKKLRKTKISFNSQLSQKIFPVLRFMQKQHKISQKKFVRKQRKFCAKDLAISWKPSVGSEPRVKDLTLVLPHSCRNEMILANNLRRVPRATCRS